MKAIITVVGKDQKGIVAGVATKVAELGLNIDDISQTVLDDYFTMMAVVSSDEKNDFQSWKNSVSLFMSKSISRAQRFLMPCTICKIGVENLWTLNR